MGSWNTVADFIIAAVVVVNALLLYLLSENLNEKMMSDFGLNSNQLVLFVIATEHVLFFIMVFIKSAIPNTPRKLIKLQERTVTEVNEMSSELKGFVIKSEMEDLRY